VLTGIASQAEGSNLVSRSKEVFEFTADDGGGFEPSEIGSSTEASDSPRMDLTNG
jgi:hypothetical protein